MAGRKALILKRGHQHPPLHFTKGLRLLQGNHKHLRGLREAFPGLHTLGRRCVFHFQLHLTAPGTPWAMVLDGSWLASGCSDSRQDWVPLDGNSEGWDLAGRSPEVTERHTERTGLCCTCSKRELFVASKNTCGSPVTHPLLRPSMVRRVRRADLSTGGLPANVL